MPSYTFNVYHRGGCLDTVFAQDTEPQDVKRSLVNHDGYPSDITVRRVWRKVLVIQGNHGAHGWEDESEYGPGEYANASTDLREYRIACPGASYRLITRRVQV